MASDRQCLQYRSINVTEAVVLTGPVVVYGCYANHGSSGQLTMRDAAAISGSNVKLIVDATAHANKELFGARFESGLTLQGSAAGTDVTVFYDKG